MFSVKTISFHWHHVISSISDIIKFSLFLQWIACKCLDVSERLISLRRSASKSTTEGLDVVVFSQFGVALRCKIFSCWFKYWRMIFQQKVRLPLKFINWNEKKSEFALIGLDTFHASPQSLYERQAQVFDYWMQKLRNMPEHACPCVSRRSLWGGYLRARFHLNLSQNTFASAIRTCKEQRI